VAPEWNVSVHPPGQVAGTVTGSGAARVQQLHSADDEDEDVDEVEAEEEAQQQ
jgi:hypothetical protein